MAKELTKNDAPELAAMADLIVGGALLSSPSANNKGHVQAARLVVLQGRRKKRHSRDAEVERLRKKYRKLQSQLEGAARRRLTNGEEAVKTSRPRSLRSALSPGTNVWEHDHRIAMVVGDLMATVVQSAIKSVVPQILRARNSCADLKAACDVLADFLDALASGLRSVGKMLSD